MVWGCPESEQVAGRLSRTPEVDLQRVAAATVGLDAHIEHGSKAQRGGEEMHGRFRSRSGRQAQARPAERDLPGGWCTEHTGPEQVGIKAIVRHITGRPGPGDKAERDPSQ